MKRNFEGTMLQFVLNDVVMKRVFASFKGLRDTETGEAPGKEAVDEIASEICEHPMFKAAIIASESDGAKMTELKDMLIVATENATTKLCDRLKAALETAFANNK